MEKNLCMTLNVHKSIKSEEKSEQKKCEATGEIGESLSEEEQRSPLIFHSRTLSIEELINNENEIRYMCTLCTSSEQKKPRN